MTLVNQLPHEVFVPRGGTLASVATAASVPLDLTQVLTSIVRQVVQEEMAVRLAEIQQAPAAQPSNEWLTINEAAQFFGVCRQTIHRWAKKGLISRYKLAEHGVTYFSKVELEAALQQQSRPDGTRKHARRSYQQHPASR